MNVKKVIYLKDYIKSIDGSLEDKIVVGSDIRPAQAVNLAVLNAPIQVVTNGFDEKKVVNIKEEMKNFIECPAKYLIEMSDSGSIEFHNRFFRDSKKSKFLNDVEAFLQESTFRKVREDIHLISDELFTNFTKSAIQNDSPITFGINANKDTVIAYCKDKQGTLNPRDMLANIQRCFDMGVKEAIKKDNNSGAGIGSYLIYSLGVGLVITVDPGKGTLVLVWMPRNVHHEDRIDMNKNLIVIEGKES